MPPADTVPQESSTKDKDGEAPAAAQGSVPPSWHISQQPVALGSGSREAGSRGAGAAAATAAAPAPPTMLQLPSQSCDASTGMPLDSDAAASAGVEGADAAAPGAACCAAHAGSDPRLQHAAPCMMSLMEQTSCSGCTPHFEGWRGPPDRHGLLLLVPLTLGVEKVSVLGSMG